MEGEKTCRWGQGRVGGGWTARGQWGAHRAQARAHDPLISDGGEGGAGSSYKKKETEKTYSNCFCRTLNYKYFNRILLLYTFLQKA